MFTQFVVNPLADLLRWLNEVMVALPLPASVSSYAMALIAVAVIVKLVTLPLTVSQLRSMRAMQALQPKLKEIQKQYKDDREKLAQAQMDLYKEHGVNPFGGCLPLLVQMPVLIGLFQAIRQLEGELAGQAFFWVKDLAIPEPVPWGDPRGIPWLIVLMTVSQYAYQKFMTPPTTAGNDAQAEMMNTMTKLMPVMFAFFFITLPAGVVLYYLAFNVVSLIQQWWLNKQADTQGQPSGALDAAPAMAELTNQGSAPQEEVTQGEPRKRRRRKKVR